MKRDKEKKQQEELIFKKHKIENEIDTPINFIDMEEVEIDDPKDKFIESSADNNNFLDSRNFKSRLTEGEMESSLMDIYSDDGELPDFKTIKIKRKRSFWVSLLYFFIFFALISLASYWSFNYIKNMGDTSSVLDIKINAPEKVLLGEDFIYEIDYRNSSKYTLNNINIEAFYPDNFILSEVYSVDLSEDNKIWKINNLAPRLGGKIKIRGKIINREGLNNLLSIKTNYEISGLSSQFSRENFSSVIVASLPFQIYEDIFSTILIGEEYPFKMNFKNFPFNKINEFVLSFSGPEDIFFIDSMENKDLDENLEIEKINNNNYKIKIKSSDVFIENFDLNFKYKVSKKNNDQEFFSWTLKYVDENSKEFIFAEKQNNLEIIKSDLHLSLSINENTSGFPVNFGDKLDYVIKYSNKGEKSMKDLVIMLVLDSDFLNWNSLSDPYKGKLSRKTISWTFKEYPELKDLQPGEGGEIKLSINVADFKKISFGQKLEIKSYAQFSIGNIEEFDSEDRISDNKSAVLVNSINSNLSLEERLLYFNDDNVPVGSGPIPPIVGEKTSFKYYWTLKNSLHELRDLKLEMDLPSYVIWENDFSTSAGDISFDPLTNKVVFNISRWPLGIDRVDINFSISIVPGDSEYNKIMILSSGSKLEAMDIETNSLIIKKTDVKTTKLDDDPIASITSDGRVR